MELENELAEDNQNAPRDSSSLTRAVDTGRRGLRRSNQTKTGTIDIRGRQSKVRMIEQVVCVGADLEVRTLSHGNCFAKLGRDGKKAWATKAVWLRIAPVGLWRRSISCADIGRACICRSKVEGG